MSGRNASRTAVEYFLLIGAASIASITANEVRGCGGLGGRSGLTPTIPSPQIKYTEQGGDEIINFY